LTIDRSHSRLLKLERHISLSVIHPVYMWPTQFWNLRKERNDGNIRSGEIR
jgi:hypothetical protein